MSATPGAGTTSKPQGGNPPGAEEKAPQPPEGGGGHIATWVFWPAAAVILLFVLFATLFPGTATEAFGAIQTNVIKWFGWYYVAAIAVFVAFALWIGLSRYGDIKLGKDEDEPEFSVHVLVLPALRRRHGHRACFLRRGGTPEPLRRAEARCRRHPGATGAAGADADLPALGAARLGHLRGGGCLHRLRGAPQEPAHLHPLDP